MKLLHFRYPSISIGFMISLLVLPSFLMITTDEPTNSTFLVKISEPSKIQNQDAQNDITNTFVNSPAIKKKRAVAIMKVISFSMSTITFVRRNLEPGMEEILRPHMQELKSTTENIQNDIKRTNRFITNEHIKTRYADAESNIHLSQETFLDYLNQPKSEYLKEKFMENAVKLESSIRIFLEGLLGNYHLKGDIMESARDFLNCRSKSLQSLMDSYSKMLLIGVVHHVAYCKLKNVTETEQSPFLKKMETSMDSIKIRLSKIIEACRDPIGVIPEMNRIGRENANTKSHQNVANELYSYLSDRFDTLIWAVFAHCSVRIDPYLIYSCCGRYFVRDRFGDRFSSFSYPLSAYYESDCFLENIPCTEAISFPLNITIPSLYDETALSLFLRRSYLQKSDNYGGKLNYVAIDSGSGAIKFSPQIPYSRFSWRFEIDYDDHRTDGNNRRKRMGVAPKYRLTNRFDLFLFPPSEIDSNAKNLITFVDPNNNNISGNYFPIINKYHQAVTVKGDYRKGWQWVWQEKYQIGRLGQLWKYTKDRQLVNKLGMCLRVYSITRLGDIYTYIIQDKCSEFDDYQKWNIASNGNIFHSYEGCLESYGNGAGDKEWLVPSKDACFRNPAGSETWTLSN